MSEEYVLPLKASKNELSRLNDLTEDDELCSPEWRFAYFMRDRSSVTSLDWIKQIIKACESGKKIVNPMSPREELKNELKKFYQLSDLQTGYRNGIHEAVRIIAKEHPDVAQWLDGDN